MLDAEFREERLAGMAKRRVANVMAQAHRFDQVFVEKKVAPNCSGDPGDKLDMQNPVADVIISDQAEYLGFVNIAGIGPGVEDAVGILGIVLPISLQLFLPTSAA